MGERAGSIDGDERPERRDALELLVVAVLVMLV
jgi:hypothetical protein